MIPGLNDAELERILEAAAAAGARTAGYVILRLPHELQSIFSEWLEAHYPLRAAHVLNLVRETRGGKLYDSEFGERMKGTGPYADILRRRFETACRRLGLTRSRLELDTTQFRVPPRAGDQPGLFDPE
jgi:DNA repair photolyase